MNLSASCSIASTLQTDISLSRAVQILITAKTASNLRPRYVKGLQQYLAQFSKGREMLPVHNFKAETIEEWFSSRSESPVTRASNLGRLGSLFGFAYRRGWIPENPVKRIERIRVDRKPPMILSPQDAADLLKAVNPHCKPFVILGMFAGVRPEEILHLKWRDIDFVRGLLTVNYSKTRRRRIVRLEPTALAWLRSCLIMRMKTSPSGATIKRMRKSVRSILPIWHQDILRHTAASYLMALHKDAGKVAAMLGNSAPVLMSHYLELVNEEDCKAFWALTPERICG